MLCELAHSEDWPRELWVVACAERNGGRVLTLDLRDFRVVAREGRITIAPDESDRS